tara:strand:+ start:631 stop:804 length:174 start_codon:yes stop_codon:yes gene_type:complete
VITTVASEALSVSEALSASIPGDERQDRTLSVAWVAVVSVGHRASRQTVEKTETDQA